MCVYCLCLLYIYIYIYKIFICIVFVCKHLYIMYIIYKYTFYTHTYTYTHTHTHIMFTYNLACFFLNIYMYVCVYVYIKQEVCSQNEQKVLRCVEKNTRMFVAEFVCALNNSNRLKRSTKNSVFYFSYAKVTKVQSVLKTDQRAYVSAHALFNAHNTNTQYTHT